MEDRNFKKCCVGGLVERRKPKPESAKPQSVSLRGQSFATVISVLKMQSFCLQNTLTESWTRYLCSKSQTKPKAQVQHAKATFCLYLSVSNGKCFWKWPKHYYIIHKTKSTLHDFADHLFSQNYVNQRLSFSDPPKMCISLQFLLTLKAS